MVGKEQIRKVKKGMRAEWPCATCAEDCVDGAIFCENCCKWQHYACENLSESQFKELSSVPSGYVCTSCCCNQKGGFHFNKALERLSKASRKGN
jgi:hypothetical protein